MKNKPPAKALAWFSRKKLDYILLFVLMTLYYGYISYNNYLADPDGFYHAKMALWLRQGHLITTLPWMQFASIGQHFTDHHLLYHILLAPFTFFNNPLIGVKVATIIFTAGAVTIFYWLLKRLYVIWPWFFAALFITLQGANFRLSLIKANSLSLIIIWLIIYALFDHKRRLLFILSALFVWLYGGWPLAIIIGLIFILADQLYNSLHRQKIKIFWEKTIHILSGRKIPRKNITLIASLAAGLIAGLVINPYFPHNLYFYYQQVIQIGLINSGNRFPVGGEWYGASLGEIISAAPHLFVFGAILLLILIFNYKNISRQTWFSFILFFVFLLLTIKSRRYVEYSLPFMLLFVATAATDAKKNIQWPKLKRDWVQASIYIKTYLIIVFLVFFTLIMPPIYQKTLDVGLEKNWPIDTFSDASLWLKNNTPPRSIVFHSDWDEWPALFYNNTHNYYIIGLDPTFMENYSPRLHKLYIDITMGTTHNNVSGLIKTNFKADYVFIEKAGHQQFIDNLYVDKNADKLYEDSTTIIYKLK